MKRLFVILPLLTAVLAFSGIAIHPVAAQTSAASWKVSYFNNENLTDPATFETTASEINFDWGDGSPNAAINKNHWSARYGTDTFFNAGTYRFSVTADDGVQLWVDFNNVLSTYNAPQPNTTLTVDVTLSAGVHHLQVDYREITGNALLKMTWVNTASIPSTPVSGSWTAQYYSNATLSGSPFAVITESNVSHQWGIGAPLNGMPADNFSVRWSSNQNLPAGSYSLQVYADDGVRVFVNGVAYIDQWHTVSGQTYSTGFNLPGGATNITVEYFESGFNAFIDFRLLAPTTSGGGTSSPAGATATVKAATLNVRNAPTTTGSVILTKIHNGETYAIVGRNDASTWWQINANGVVGWVSGLFVTVANTGSVPIASSTPSNTPSQQPTQFVITTLNNLNLRAEPTTGADSLLVIPRGGTAPVLARSSNNSWLHVNYNGVIGWVSIRYVVSTPPLNLSQIPVG